MQEIKDKNLISKRIAHNDAIIAVVLFAF